jgi:hypothetical protein
MDTRNFTRSAYIKKGIKQDFQTLTLAPVILRIHKAFLIG